MIAILKVGWKHRVPRDLRSFFILGRALKCVQKRVQLGNLIEQHSCIYEQWSRRTACYFQEWIAVFFPAAYVLLCQSLPFSGRLRKTLGIKTVGRPTWPQIRPFGSAHVCLKLLASCGSSLAWGHFSIPQKAKPAGRSWHCWGHLDNAPGNPWKSLKIHHSKEIYMILHDSNTILLYITITYYIWYWYIITFAVTLTSY